MRLLIKQRVFSWTDSYDVYDENENAKYFVKAELSRRNCSVGEIPTRLTLLIRRTNWKG